MLLMSTSNPLLKSLGLCTFDNNNLKFGGAKPYLAHSAILKHLEGILSTLSLHCEEATASNGK